MIIFCGCRTYLPSALINSSTIFADYVRNKIHRAATSDFGISYPDDRKFAKTSMTRMHGWMINKADHCTSKTIKEPAKILRITKLAKTTCQNEVAW